MVPFKGQTGIKNNMKYYFLKVSPPPPRKLAGGGLEKHLWIVIRIVNSLCLYLDVVIIINIAVLSF
jgi:hypothetical protein